jgi:hypothetical protein
VQRVREDRAPQPAAPGRTAGAGGLCGAQALLALSKAEAEEQLKQRSALEVEVRADMASLCRFGFAGTRDPAVCQMRETIEKAQSWELLAGQYKEQLSSLEASPCRCRSAGQRWDHRARGTLTVLRPPRAVREQVQISELKSEVGKAQGESRRGSVQLLEAGRSSARRASSLLASEPAASVRSTLNGQRPSAGTCGARVERCAVWQVGRSTQDGAEIPQPARRSSVQLLDGSSTNASAPRRASLLPGEETQEVAACLSSSILAPSRRRFLVTG